MISFHEHDTGNKITKQFNVGDRVRCYTSAFVRKGTVVDPWCSTIQDTVFVRLDLNCELKTFHPKQVRRLVRKEKPKAREWWVYRVGPHHYWSASQFEPVGEWQEKFKVREVTEAPSARGDV